MEQFLVTPFLRTYNVSAEINVFTLHALNLPLICLISFYIALHTKGIIYRIMGAQSISEDSNKSSKPLNPVYLEDDTTDDPDYLSISPGKRKRSKRFSEDDDEASPRKKEKRSPKKKTNGTTEKRQAQ